MHATTTAGHATAYRDAFGGLKTLGLALGAACLLGFGLLVALSNGGAASLPTRRPISRSKGAASSTITASPR